jgi:hypothetical protein
MVRTHEDTSVNASEETVDTGEFGPDMTQTLTLGLNREMCRVIHNLVPQIGDIVEWNSSYYEINNTNQSKFPGGQVDFNFTNICSAHITRQPMTLIADVRVGTSV